MAIVEVAGVTAIDTSVFAGTVKVVEPEIAPTVAVMVVCPVATVEATPAEVIVATELDDELQVAVELGAVLVVPSVYVPITVNC